MNVTDALVGWSMSATYRDLTPEALAQAKWVLADSLCCMIGGSRTEIGDALLRFLPKSDQGGGVTILGTDRRADPSNAAFVNATLANALDFDDTYEQDGKGLAHPSATLVGTALSASAMRPTTGKDFLTALVVGHEAAARIGESVQPSPEVYVRQWGVGHFDIFGSVLIASRILGLDLESARHAFGIAGVAANPPSAWQWNWEDRSLPLSWMKDMVGWPSESGLRAARLAQSGFRGCLSILDGEYPWWSMIGSDRFDPARIMDNLGQAKRVANAAFKPYPCCRWIHSSVDAFLGVFQSSGLTPEDIAEVEVFTLSELANHFAVTNPKSMVDAEFSVPYAIAMAALGIPSGPQWHDQGLRLSQKTTSLTSKVRVIASEELDRNYFENRRLAAKVVLKGKDGRTWKGECPQASGGRDRPMSREQHLNKFVQLVDPVLGAGSAMKLFGFTQACEKAADFYRELVPLVSC